MSHHKNYKNKETIDYYKTESLDLKAREEQALGLQEETRVWSFSKFNSLDLGSHNGVTCDFLAFLKMNLTQLVYMYVSGGIVLKGGGRVGREGLRRHD